MRALWAVVSVVVLMGAVYGGWRVGMLQTVASIKATCDGADTLTVLEGNDYVCINAVTWMSIVKQLKERGA